MGEIRAGTGGAQYLPYAKRTGNESIVYFTRDLSARGIITAYRRVAEAITGRVAIKLHTGEAHGPNILPHAWIEKLVKEALPQATIVETNTLYAGDRDTTEKHRETLKTNGWTFCPVDILDEDGATKIPVEGGKWFTEMSVGSHIDRYDALAVLTHFKGHTLGGFGGSMKNIAIGMADAEIGKRMMHTPQHADGSWDENTWAICEEEFMERMVESAKATVDYFGKHITFVNVMRNMSVSCDCEGLAAEPVVTPNVGILASTDILALDQACVDLIYAMKPEESAAMRERMESRHGLRQLSYMKELGMGHDRYLLIDIDNDDRHIQPHDAVQGLFPFNEMRGIPQARAWGWIAHI